jgi:DNA repair protein RadC
MVMPTSTPTRPYTIPGFRIALVREPGVRLAERPQFRAPDVAAPMLAQYIGETDREVFVIAMLTIRHRVLGLHTVSIGCLTSSLVHPREVFKPAILAGSAAIIAAHNHPSGDPEPSAEDTALTRRIASAGTILGIELLDHLILGEAGRFVSLRERGVL